MADVQVTAGETLLIKIGDGGSPENFNHSCSINTSRSFTITANESSVEVADCTTPSNPAYVARKVKSTDITVEGAGTYDAASEYALLTWALAGTAKNCKISQTNSGALGGFTITVPMILSSLGASGERGDFLSSQMSLKQAGKATLAQNA